MEAAVRVGPQVFLASASTVVPEPEYAKALGFGTGDHVRIRQVLSNLVSNAVKFTTAGSVSVAIEAFDTGVQLRVIDTGIGLTDEQIPQVFDKFSQADASTTRRYGGTGLGLSICRELVQRMRGTIDVSSHIGEGSSFSVTLPLRRASSGPDIASELIEAPAPTAQLRVLAAEDNATNQLVLRALFEPLDVHLTLTSNGRERWPPS